LSFLLGDNIIITDHKDQDQGIEVGIGIDNIEVIEIVEIDIEGIQVDIENKEGEIDIQNITDQEVQEEKEVMIEKGVMIEITIEIEINGEKIIL